MKRAPNFLKVLSVMGKLKLFVLLFAVFLFAALPAWAGINQWTPLGPYGGQVKYIAISPNYAADNTVYVEAGYGIFKTTNGGSTWTIVSSGFSYNVSSVEISPNYAVDNTLYAGTSGGVYKSNDAGNSWSHVLPLSPPTADCYVAISPNYAVDHTVYAGRSGSSVILFNIFQLKHSDKMTQKVGYNKVAAGIK